MLANAVPGITHGTCAFRGKGREPSAKLIGRLGSRNRQKHLFFIYFFVDSNHGPCHLGWQRTQDVKRQSKLVISQDFHCCVNARFPLPEAVRCVPSGVVGVVNDRPNSLRADTHTPRSVNNRFWFEPNTVLGTGIC